MPHDVKRPPQMTYMRAYLLRAIYDWVLDNACAPHILVDALVEGVEVPKEYIKDDKIVLNISPNSVQGLRLLNSHVEFNATFAGVPMHIYLPILSILAIYANENGKGMVFSEEDGIPPGPNEPDDSGKGSSTGGKKGRSHLKVVK